VAVGVNFNETPNPPKTVLTRDVRPHSILDPFHGLIRLSELEFGVIDHPLFRRLRKIKQNGLLLLVFPSATHHRFAHSCGVMHIADVMLEQVWLNSVVSARKGAIEPYETDRTNVAIDFSAIPEPVLRWVVKVTRLAALVHDLGHGPLSHTFDSFALYREDLAEMLRGDSVPSLTAAQDRLFEWDRKGSIPGSVQYDRVPHEVMSCVFFGHIWDSLVPAGTEHEGLLGDEAKTIPLAVTAAILGDPGIAASTHTTEQLRWLPFIHDLIASAPADADRMDYLERDSRTIGVNYGLFDRNRIMKSLLCFREGEGANSVYRLGVKRSGISAMENLVQARYELFVQVYYHKTNFAIGLMLKEIARVAQKEQFRLFSADSSGTAMAFAQVRNRYIDLSDDQFLRVLRGLDPGYPAMPRAAILLADAIERRELWKRLYETDEKGAKVVFDNLRASENAEVASDLLLRMSEPKATKDLDKGATLLARGEDGKYAPLRGHTWYGSSVIIRALSKAEANVGRVYARGAALQVATRKSLVREARRVGREYEAQRELQRKADRESHLRLQSELDRGRENAPFEQRD
jgi:uncharacterized protein